MIYRYIGAYPAVITIFPGGENFPVKPGDVREFDEPPRGSWVPVEPEVKDEPEAPARTNRKGQAHVDA